MSTETRSRKKEWTDEQHWLSRSEWLLDDAVLLVLGIDPNRYPRPRVDPGYVGQSIRMKPTPPPPFWKLLRTAMDAEGRELAVLEYSSKRGEWTGCAKVQPAAFVSWAKQAGYIIPNEMDHLLSGVEEQSETKRPIVRPIKRPIREDLWFYAIHDAVKEFEEKHQFTPTNVELWGYMAENSQNRSGVGYDNRHKQLTMSAAKELTRKNFNGRYARYYPPHVAE